MPEEWKCLFSLVSFQMIVFESILILNLQMTEQYVCPESGESFCQGKIKNHTLGEYIICLDNALMENI